MAMITLGTIAAITAYRQSHDGLGNLRFNNSSSHNFRAQTHFLKGLKHLNLFANQDAEVEFTKALEIDPNFMMAKIGTALAQKSHLGYGASNEIAGRAVLSAIGCNSTETCKISNHEFGYLIATRAYFAHNLTEQQKLQQFSTSMESLATEFPNDSTAGAMFAVSLLSEAAASPSSKQAQLLARAQSLLEKLFEEFPQHPGVLLGMILAFDSPDPQIAQTALKASKKIYKLVYKSSLALHAATHISQTLGNYSEVLLENRKAYTNSVAKCSSRFVPLDVQDYCEEDIKYMSLEWVHNALMMKCDYTEGMEIMNDFEHIFMRNPKHAPFQGWLLRMYARQVFASKAIVTRITHSSNVGRRSWVPATIEGDKTSVFWDAYSEAGALFARGHDILKSQFAISEEDSRALMIISNRLLDLANRNTTTYVKNAIMSMQLVHLASSKFFDCKERLCAEESIAFWNRAVAIERANKRERNTQILPFESTLTLYAAFIIENLAYFRHSQDIDVEVRPTLDNAIDLLQESILMWGPRTKTILLLHKATNEDPIQKSRWSLNKAVVYKTLKDYNINPQCLV